MNEEEKNHTLYLKAFIVIFNAAQKYGVWTLIFFSFLFLLRYIMRACLLDHPVYRSLKWLIDVSNYLFEIVYVFLSALHKGTLSVFVRIAIMSKWIDQFFQWK